MSITSKRILLVVHDDVQLVRQIAKMTSELAEVIHLREIARVSRLVESDQPLSTVVVGTPAGGVSPIDILGTVRAKRPQVRCVMIAEAGDLSASIEALHSGVVDHLLTSPLRERELSAILALPMHPSLGQISPARQPLARAG